MKWIVIGAVPLLVVAGGGAGWFFTRGDAGASAAPVQRPPQFMQLENFTVNLAEESGDHYLQIGIVYQVEDNRTVDNLKLYMPILRDQILRLLSAKRPSDIASSAGKGRLVDELVAAARTSIPGPTPEKGVRGALLSAFVIQ